MDIFSVTSRSILHYSEVENRLHREKKYHEIINPKMNVVAELHKPSFDVKLDKIAKELVFMKKIVGKKFDKKSGKLTLEITKGKFKTISREEDMFALCDDTEKKTILDKLAMKLSATKSSTPASDRLGRAANL